ncbi:MAG: Iron(3+)-hydroxamate import system permease protein FhuB [Candidatus Erwinia impunctatus]|nr:Iron(3+)-hydroxamate import system permease protein FhuB [Culicoides impunctatus]
MALVICGLLLLTLYNFSSQLPVTQWIQAVVQPGSNDIAQLVFHYSLLPRFTLALLVGAGLGLAGLLFQLVLRNPLAEPTTLGVSAGAQIGMTIATLWFPGVMLIAQFASLAGALLVGGLVFAIAWRKTLSPLTLILAGLVLSLYCGAVNQLLGLFHHDGLQNLYLWSTGTLNQLDWHQVRGLWLPLLCAMILALLLVRPLALLAVDDTVARNLGVGVTLCRLGVLLLAIMLSAQLVSAAGIIAFVALFAPQITRIIGIRQLYSRLLFTPLFGMLLLWGADQLAMLAAFHGYTVATGTVTALVGAPLLL